MIECELVVKKLAGYWVNGRYIRIIQRSLRPLDGQEPAVYLNKGEHSPRVARDRGWKIIRRIDL